MTMRRPSNLPADTAASPEAAESQRSRRMEILILTARVNFNP